MSASIGKVHHYVASLLFERRFAHYIDDSLVLGLIIYQRHPLKYCE